ncbi:MAG: acyltransferase [Dermatophilaceae bacterium]
MTRGENDSTIATTAASTPPSRDRWADALRVGSLLVVIIGHWFMVAVTPDGEISNALKIIPALQPVTWVLQVMPLFFLVGGVAHAHTLDRLASQPGTTRGRYAAFIRARAVRLMRPTLAFLAVWVLLGAIAHLAGFTRGGQGRLVTAALVMVPQLLWFVGIYLGIAAFAPAMYRAHQRWGRWAAGALVTAAVVVDMVRFGAGLGIVGNLNFALVWLALHQLGFAWRDGTLTRRGAWLLTAVGTAGLLGRGDLGSLPHLDGRPAGRRDLQHGATHRGPPGPRACPDRRGRPRPPRHGPRARTPPDMAPRRHRRRLRDDRLPLAPHRAAGNPAHDAGARRAFARGRHRRLVVDPAALGRCARHPHCGPSGGLPSLRPALCERARTRGWERRGRHTRRIPELGRRAGGGGDRRHRLRRPHGVDRRRRHPGQPAAVLPRRCGDPRGRLRGPRRRARAPHCRYAARG